MEREALEKKLELRLGLPGDELEYKSQVFQQQKNTDKNAETGSQTRANSVPVVGWPPLGTFRKNIAGNSSKTLNESQNVALKSEVKLENCKKKRLFVKINMDGMPIGRKINLKAYDNYIMLSLAVEELFRELLAGICNSSKEKKAFTGLLDGSGDYTLVYQDNEGDKMLVGDVPWDMFVSTAKRLQLLKTSDLSALSSKSVSRNWLR
ncbi:AUX/IAA protein [Dioscorea alata]|uniref:AUX/IAA protein n=1 Tax=Dioscorea alata TaxID=55571 RepID=A0ACB7TVZ1_DIOAL|nr:AUX/IAA protein [Dioscorea alata]